MNPNFMELIMKKEKKYFDLVWYARKDPDKFYSSNTLTEIQKVRETYPEECEALEDPDIGDWTHGFNSGILAALRYVMTLCDDTIYCEVHENPDQILCEQCSVMGGEEQAEEEFPMLDT